MPSFISARALRAVALALACLALLPSGPAAAAPAENKDTRAERQAQKKALAELPQVYREWLEEVDVIITPAEKKAFLELDKDYQRDAFIKAFWESRDNYKDTARNEFHDRWQALVREARERFPAGLKDERARILLLNGPPTVAILSTCSMILSPLEIWYYQQSELLHFEFFILFYQRWGSGPYIIWHPSDGLDELFSITSEPSRRTLSEINSGCRDGDKIAAAINWIVHEGLGYATLESRFTTKPKGPGRECVDSFKTYSTDLPEDARTFPAKLALDFPGRYQARTVVQGLLTVPVADVVEAKLGEARSYNFALTGEVLQGKVLFDSFRYKYDFPVEGGAAAGAAPGTNGAPAATPGTPAPPANTAATTDAAVSLPVLFQRYLRPGAYDLVLRLEDLNSGKFYRSQQKIEVPARDNLAPAPIPADPVDIESIRLLNEANAAIGSGETTLKIIPPRGEFQTGMLRIDTLSTGPDIDKVTFALGGKALLTKRKPPYSVELDLGSLPRTRRLTATAFDASGNQVAGDDMLLNTAGHRFRVRLVEPHKGKTYKGSLLARAEVEVPEGEAVERVEFYLNEALLATAYQPLIAGQKLYEQPILLPQGTSAGYVRAVAYLIDGSSTENLVFINTPDYPEEVDVQFVELYTTVLDREGRPVEGLTEKDFTPYEDGVKQQVRRFERVTDLPIHAAVAIDVSASMEPSIDQTRKAALEFLQNTIRPKDRGAVITFNDHPHLAVKFSSDPQTLAGGLTGLKAERGTALYDSIIFSLYYFNGIKGQRAILLLSDGKDEGSRFTYDAALDYARRAGVTIYSIGLGEDLDKKKLTKLAEETGGRSFFVKEASELAGIYAAIEHELRSQYLIAYQSTNPGVAGGAFRNVELKMTKPGLEAKTIRGYYP